MPWACFKGHLDVFQVLVKTGLHWEDVDSCGNNSVMLAAAGNSIEIFKAFLQWGVDLDCKNSSLVSQNYAEIFMLHLKMLFLVLLVVVPVDRWGEILVMQQQVIVGCTRIETPVSFLC